MSEQLLVDLGKYNDAILMQSPTDGEWYAYTPSGATKITKEAVVSVQAEEEKNEEVS